MSASERGFYVRPIWLLLGVLALAAGSVWQFCPVCAPPRPAAPPADVRGAAIDAPARTEPASEPPLAMTPVLDPQLERILALLREETPLLEQELALLRAAVESGVATEDERQEARDALDRILLGGDPAEPLEKLTRFLLGRAAPAPATEPGAPPPPPPPSPEPPAVPADSPYKEVTFDTLAAWHYEYPTTVPSDAEGLRRLHERIPESIRKLDGTLAAVKGYMLPIDVDRDSVLSFLLVRFPFGCCYGRPPQMNEWIFVKMAPGKRAEFVSHIPVPVLGKLSVGDEFEQGSVTSVYRMVADDVVVPLAAPR